VLIFMENAAGRYGTIFKKKQLLKAK